MPLTTARLSQGASQGLEKSLVIISTSQEESFSFLHDHFLLSSEYSIDLKAYSDLRSIDKNSVQHCLFLPARLEEYFKPISLGICLKRKDAGTLTVSSSRGDVGRY